MTEVLGLREEVQKQRASQPGPGGSAVGMGEGCPRRLCHRHLGSTPLMSVVQLRLLKDLAWGPPGGSPGRVTRLVWKEKASVGQSLVSTSCRRPSQTPRSRPGAGVLCSDSARTPIRGFSWPTPTAVWRLPLEEHRPMPPTVWTLWRLAGRSSEVSPCPGLVHRVVAVPTHGWRSARPSLGPSARLHRSERLLAQVHPCLILSPSIPLQSAC